MTNNLRELSYDQLVEHTSEVLEELRHRAYHEGFKQGRFEAQVESMYPAKEPEKESPQQARDRIVEQAKDDITELIPDESHFEGKYYRVNHVLGNRICEADFVVNKGKRTVVAIMRGCISGKVYARGIAKCAPGDCFNVHIGKAIALRRALGLEVPDEYLNAPQPTEVRVGDIVKWKDEYVIIGIKDEAYRFRCERDGWVSAYLDYDSETIVSKITDDSREGVTQ